MNPNTSVNVGTCNAKTEATEKRLLHLEAQQDEYNKSQISVAECLAKLTVLCEASSQAHQQTNERLAALEHRPGKFWDKIIIGALSGVIGAVFTSFVQTWLI